MKIIKRSGCEVDFDITKIIVAITKANNQVPETNKLTAAQIREIAIKVENKGKTMSHAPSVEEIQDMVEDQIMAHSAYALARVYITYRYTHSLIRKSNTTDDQILSLIECNNEEVKQENSNKNPTVSSVKRDYMAGEVSKDITKRILLPQDIVEAHEQGILHFHDADYFARHMHNCDTGQFGGHAAKRHRHFRHHDRKAAQLFHSLQYRNTDYCTGGIFPVRRSEYFPDPSGTLCGCEPQEDSQRDGSGVCHDSCSTGGTCFFQAG